MSQEATSKTTRNVTFLQESAAGASPSNALEYLQTDLFGQEAAPVRLSPALESRKASRTSETCGQSFSGSSASAALNGCLASRLRELCGTVGSTVYRQTWREKATPSGLRYWAHTARAPTTSDKDCTGRPTPTVDDSGNASRASGQFTSLTRTARMAGWPTPNTLDSVERSGLRPSRIATNRTSGYLSEIAPMASWKTPHASDGEGGVMEIRPDADGHYKLRDQAQLAGWATPTVRDMKDTGDMTNSMTRKDGQERNDTLGRQTFGLTQCPTSAKTGNGGVLNPAFSRWLQSFPEVWDTAAILAYRSMSTRQVRRGSCVSRATATPSA